MDGKTGRFRPGGRALANVVVLLGGLAAMAFVLAAAAFPGGGYNPAMQMLSVLGRSQVRLVEQPWCRYVFVVGMFFSVAAVLVAARAFRLSAWGAALNAAGLVAIALFPENEGWLRHAASRRFQESPTVDASKFLCTSLSICWIPLLLTSYV